MTRPVTRACPPAVRPHAPTAKIVFVLVAFALLGAPLRALQGTQGPGLPPGVTSYGVSTPACSGPIVLTASGSALPGQLLTLSSTGAPPNAPAMVILGSIADVAGTSLAGITAHVQLVPGTFWSQNATTNSQGGLSLTYAVPNQIRTYFVQMVFGTTPNCPGTGLLASSTALRVDVSANAPAATVGRYDVFEATIVRPVNYGTQANFQDVTLDAVFTPVGGGAPVNVGGFYYDSPSASESHWKIRFAPSVVGTWTYAWTWRHVPSGAQTNGSGSFECVLGSNPGFLRRNPNNPYRLQFSDGTPFAPVGWNLEASLDGGGNGVNSSNQPIRGAFTDWLAAMVEPKEVIRAYADAGFRMVRFKNRGPSSEALCDTTAATFDKDVAKLFDARFQFLREQGVRILYGIWGNALGTAQSSFTTAQQRFVQYSINRFGAYVDIWQLQNEKVSTAAWVTANVNFIRARDPYGHPVTQSWEQPSNASLDMLTPHQYLLDTTREADATIPTWLNVATGSTYTPAPWKTYNRPIIIGEAGQMYRNWDADSRVRMRLHSWSTLFAECTILYFPTNLLTNFVTSGVANVYIGREERMDNQILARFTDAVLRGNTTIFTPTVSVSSVRGYGLSSPGAAVALWLNHWYDHTTSVANATVTFNSPISGTGRWIDPATGQIVATTTVAAGTNTKPVPSITKDLAFFAVAGPLATDPLALYTVSNSQWDGDLDNDGNADIGPTAPPFGAAPLALGFDATRSVDWDGGAVYASWDFGDGTGATGLVTSHSFPRGTHHVVLTITDDEGRTARQRFVVRAMADTVPNQSNLPVFTRIPPITVKEGQPIHLMPTAADPELVSSAYSNSALTYSATGLPPGATYVANSMSYKDFLWTPKFDQAGTYTITFRAQDASGASATLPVTITVLDAPELPSAN